MNTERDRFLTEAIGERWHENLGEPFKCFTCRVECVSYHPSELAEFARIHTDNDFSTWEGFGKLWEWAQEQEWLGEFWHTQSLKCNSVECYVNPDRFANAVYEYLKE